MTDDEMGEALTAVTVQLPLAYMSPQAVTAALLPVVRKIAADELLWAATEAECHHDLVMLKRRAAALDPA